MFIILSGETSIQQFLVLVSLDTKTKDPQQMPLSEASQGVKSKGINVYSVGIKPGVDQQDLEDTTTKPSNVYIIPSDQLANTGKRIADTIKGYVDDPNRQTGQYYRFTLTLEDNTIVCVALCRYTTIFLVCAAGPEWRTFIFVFLFLLFSLKDR